METIKMESYIQSVDITTLDADAHLGLYQDVHLGFNSKVQFDSL